MSGLLKHFRSCMLILWMGVWMGLIKVLWEKRLIVLIELRVDKLMNKLILWIGVLIDMLVGLLNLLINRLIFWMGVWMKMLLML